MAAALEVAGWQASLAGRWRQHQAQRHTPFRAEPLKKLTPSCTLVQGRSDVSPVGTKSIQAGRADARDLGSGTVSTWRAGDLNTVAWARWCDCRATGDSGRIPRKSRIGKNSVNHSPPSAVLDCVTAALCWRVNDTGSPEWAPNLLQRRSARRGSFADRRRGAG